MARTKVTQKKVSLSELNNHNVSNKRQALKDLKMLNFDELQFKNPAPVSYTHLTLPTMVQV